MWSTPSHTLCKSINLLFILSINLITMRTIMCQCGRLMFVKQGENHYNLSVGVSGDHHLCCGTNQMSKLVLKSQTLNRVAAIVVANEIFLIKFRISITDVDVKVKKVGGTLTWLVITDISLDIKTPQGFYHLQLKQLHRTDHHDNQNHQQTRPLTRNTLSNTVRAELALLRLSQLGLPSEKCRVTFGSQRYYLTINWIEFSVSCFNLLQTFAFRFLSGRFSSSRAKVSHVRIKESFSGESSLFHKIFYCYSLISFGHFLTSHQHTSDSTPFKNGQKKCF